MQPSSNPTFGKRKTATARRTARTDSARPNVASNHAALFADIRREVETPEAETLAVPRSFRAALLAGLVVGACLAGLDVTNATVMPAGLDPLLKMSGLSESVERALPFMIALSLFSGARIAATTLLIAHRVLSWTGQSSHVAYALGGGALTAAYAGIVLAITHHQPQHGWAIDIAAGAGAGFFYRMFAGAKRV